MSDRNLISKQDHELETILRHYSKRTTVSNKNKLKDIIDEFKNDTNYFPHNRENFYLYLEENSYIDFFE